MQKYDLCCIGHVTLDKVITPQNTVHMPGGTSYYCSHAIRRLNKTNYSLIASLAKTEFDVIRDFENKGLVVHAIESPQSVYFENIYGENQDERTQRVLAKAAPFKEEDIENIEAKIFFLGALLADDFPLEFVKKVSKKGLVAIDSQGYLRKVIGEQVFPTDWDNKLEFLKHTHFLKVNEMEMEVLTGQSDTKKAAEILYNWGVKEVVITLGSMGSIIYDGTNFHPIPAYQPSQVLDATGCGDTYMAGYLYQRAKSASHDDAGKFGAAMATIKIEGIGPFKGSIEEIYNRINNSPSKTPQI